MQHLFRMIARPVGNLHAAEHAGYFVHAIARGKLPHRGMRRVSGRCLGYFEVMVGLAGNLGQVGHADNLAAPAQSPEALTDNLRDPAPYTCVHLVEYQRWGTMTRHRDHLDGETQARQLAP